MTVIANIRVGKPDTTPSGPGHTWGVGEGNNPHRPAQEPGLQRIGQTLRVTGRRSTGVNPDRRLPIDPTSPILTPA